MNKRYQVFISSTFTDLIEERREVIQALLELDCIPSGMELFPASNDDQWSLIKKVIDDSDYYIVIIGGRYGSISELGISYTEMEYRYAVESGKPVMAFIHANPGEISVSKSEQDRENRKKLEDFLDLVKKKLVRTWTSPADLGSVVSRSLVQLIKREPAIGWVKASNVLTESASKEILKLKNRIEELELMLETARVSAPAGTDELAKGSNVFGIEYTYSIKKLSDYSTETYLTKVNCTWNQIFYELSPLMIDETVDSSLRVALNKMITKLEYSILSGDYDKKKYQLQNNFRIEEESFQTIKVQLRALGLIRKNSKNRSVKDTNTYWSLTDYGDEMMTRLRAIKKD